jgi:hypothetical protein
LDQPDSASQRYMAELVSVLNSQFVDELVAFDYELPKPPEAKTGKKTKGKERQTKPPEIKESVSGRRENRQQRRASLDRAAGFKAPRTTRQSLANQLAADQAGNEKLATEEDAKAAERRRSRVPSSQPAFVNQVDNRSSFKNFESGWILPEGSSRRRTISAPPPNAVQPAAKSRPRKPEKAFQAKKEVVTSVLSNAFLGEPCSNSESLRTASSELSELSDLTDLSDADDSPPVMPQRAAEAENAPAKVVQDTSSAQAAEASEGIPPASPPKSTGPSSLPVDKTRSPPKSAIAASFLTDKVNDTTRASPAGKHQPKAKAYLAELARVKALAPVTSETELPDGTLVW